MPEVQPTPLPPETAARLTAFARACRGAARTVSLYPPEHRAIGDAMERLAHAAASATESGPLSILVLPDNLLVGGQTTPRPDTAVVELAALLHAHMVGEITIRSQVEMPAWRTLLDLLGSDPEDVRARGGLARALTTAGGVGIEIAELDYSGLITDDASGTEASWELDHLGVPAEGRDRSRREDAADPRGDRQRPGPPRRVLRAHRGAAGRGTRRATARPACCGPSRASPDWSAARTRTGSTASTTTWRPRCRTCRPTSCVSCWRSAAIRPRRTPASWTR